MSTDGTTASKRLFFREAFSSGLAEEMRRDPTLILFGQDIGAFGGAYKEFKGLIEEFGPSRVRETPIAEAAMVGVAVGLAAAGMRALVSITYMDFLMLGLDPLVNFAAKARFKTGGLLKAPVVVKTTAGALGQGVAHSQCLESWLMNVPGLKVVAPSDPADAYTLLRSALREDGPVVYVDHKRLFPISGEVTPTSPPVAIGRARILRAGHQVTIVAYSYMTRVALEAAERMSGTVSCEVIDLRSLSPLDIDTISDSVSRTGALVTVEEGQLICGVGTEIAFKVRETCGSVRVARVGALPAPVSSNPVLEAANIPNAIGVVKTISRLLGLQTI